MVDGMRADPDQLVGAAAGFDILSERVSEASAALAAALDAEGASWGADDPGTTFAAQYTPGRDVATAAIRQLAATFAAVAAGLRDTGAAFAATDDGFAGTLGGGH
ncbi:WXG100 family type VII secretion target [Prescottella subtropica]|uniref:WXG100 family type VII secretion target n=1 Tax=Prescottella subtropica TaxID=2545757 RepID=UPI0010F6B62D|nr:WXG100 family type VII secretion target [Prescottella subtropica]